MARKRKFSHAPAFQTLAVFCLLSAICWGPFLVNVPYWP
jgi:hypothetical protein